MRLRVRSFRRLVTLALPCWLLGGPLASTLQGIANCPHHDAMPAGMDHGSGPRAPCWCADMTGSAAAEVPTLPQASPEQSGARFLVPVVTAATGPQSVALPTSPSFPPTPPPPNAHI